jgi:hypothetical protein
MAIYHGPIPPPTGNTGTFKPIDWDKIAIPVSSISGGSITATNTLGTTISLPGELLDYTIMYELDWIQASGMSEEDLNNHLKKELAAKLAAKMMEDGHIVFTKQQNYGENSIRYRAYTWVGNQHFIEQQRKNKR